MFPAAERILDKIETVEHWMLGLESRFELPLYLSVDIRDSGFKSAIVDTNLFPAGFNNLPKDAHTYAASCFQEALLQAGISQGKVLLVIEEHTRNLWYLENAYVLKSLIEKAGYDVEITTAFPLEEIAGTLLTAVGNEISIHDPRDIESKLSNYQAILLNNDLSSGVPKFLESSPVPVLPHPELGWHKRSKKRHFDAMTALLHQLAEILDLDPWELIPLNMHVPNIDIHDQLSRDRLVEHADELLQNIAGYYKKFGIERQPHLYVKSDSGTYGMGIQLIESADQLKNLNRKTRNKLNAKKGTHIVDSFLLQECIPTSLKVNELPAEVVLYQVDKHAVGGFYRLNNQKDELSNLNSRGMLFHPLPEPGKSPVERLSYFHRLLGRIAAVAAACEKRQIELPDETCFSY